MSSGIQAGKGGYNLKQGEDECGTGFLCTAILDASMSLPLLIWQLCT
jgi:hypothetical protein